jgi:CHAD domain-containing protein
LPEETVTQHLEIEHKYDADSHFTLPDLTDLPGCASVSAPESVRLKATYLDTDDFRLAAWSITLRRREGGEDAGWHVKIPAGPDAKIEVRAPLGRTTTAPARLTKLVAACVRGRTLGPIATLETHRTITRLLDAEGRVLAEIADDAVCGQVLTIEDTAVSTWREIEVELGPAGSPELLKAVGKRLRRSGAHRAGSHSKLGRLLDTHGAVPAAPAIHPPSRPATAGEVPIAYLAAQIEALTWYDPKARLAEHDAVHRMRVAVRRTRSVLKSYGPLLDRTRTDSLQPELKWLADLLGEVRDLEVLRSRFSGRLEELPDEVSRHRAWLDAMAAQEKKAYDRLNAELTGRRYFDLLDALDRLVLDPPYTERAGLDAAHEVSRLVIRAWHRLVRAYEDIETFQDSAEADAARHQARKDAKRARYAAEAATTALGRTAARLADQAKRVQEVFGGYQDGVIAQERLALTAAGAAPEELFTLGVLSGLEHCAAQAALHDIPEVWRKADRAGHAVIMRSIGD